MWEVMDCLSTDKELGERLAEGWEPFAVTLVKDSVGYHWVWLRKQTPKTDEELEEEMRRMKTLFEKLFGPMPVPPGTLTMCADIPPKPEGTQ